MWGAGLKSIAVCDRCNFKMDYTALRADGNSPGLRVCQECWDPKNPWRDPPIQPDAITLRFPRPDTPLVVGNTTDVIIPPIPSGDYIATEGGRFIATEGGDILTTEN